VRGVTASSEVPFELEVAAVTDVGTEREHNEDRCGHLLENESCGLLVVADGVSSAEAGETASQTAVAATLRTFAEQPAGTSTAKRLYRAVQQANIEVYDLATVVPELRGMTTTLTAVAVDRGELTAAHIGDSRLYLLRGGRIVQLTKDHTVAAERARIGLLSKARARTHKDRSVLTRSLGRELIVPIDRLSNRLFRGDVLLVCSDGLYNALDDEELARLLDGGDAGTATQRLIDTANQRGTLDNLTAAVLRVRRGPELPAASAGLGARLRGLFGRRGG
jgi:PPM family protein phosphatase